MIERKFIEDKIKSLEIEEYLMDTLQRADYSHTDIQITPLSTRLVVHVGRPGIAIGRGGKNIQTITENLSKRFGIKNPQLDIQSIENPNLDASYVANKIAMAIEQYIKPNRITNIYLRNIMNAGAHGAEIQISGKISGGRGRTDKKYVGYIKKSGDFALANVDVGDAIATLKPGVLGIKVMIMKALPESMIIEDKIKKIGQEMKKDKEDKKEENGADGPSSESNDKSEDVQETKEEEDKVTSEKKDSKVEPKKEETKKQEKDVSSETKKKTDDGSSEEKKGKDAEKKETVPKETKKTDAKETKSSEAKEKKK